MQCELCLLEEGGISGSTERASNPDLGESDETSQRSESHLTCKMSGHPSERARKHVLGRTRGKS